MKYLVFDTETTGAFPKSDEFGNWLGTYKSWPKLVQIAWVVGEIDSTGKASEIYRVDYILKPNGWKVTKASQEIHGISHSLAMQKGAPLDFVLFAFNKAVNFVDLVVSHNLSFDEQVMNGAFTMLGYENPMLECKRFCTMRTTNEFVGNKLSNGQYKWPKLWQLQKAIKGGYIVETHNAVDDTNTLNEILIWLLSNDWPCPFKQKYVPPMIASNVHYWKQDNGVVDESSEASIIQWLIFSVLIIAIIIVVFVSS